MNAKIDDLSGDTIFTHEGKKWKKGGMSWSSRATDDYLGPKEVNVGLYQCYPFLGGQFQQSLSKWFNVNTIVTIDY